MSTYKCDPKCLNRPYKEFRVANGQFATRKPLYIYLRDFGSQIGRADSFRFPFSSIQERQEERTRTHDVPVVITIEPWLKLDIRTTAVSIATRTQKYFDQCYR